MKLVCKDSWQLLAVRYCLKKVSSQMFDWVLSTLLTWQISIKKTSSTVFFYLEGSFVSFQVSDQIPYIGNIQNPCTTCQAFGRKSYLAKVNTMFSKNPVILLFDGFFLENCRCSSYKHLLFCLSQRKQNLKHTLFRCFL